jgi:hypothetical protein
MDPTQQTTPTNPQASTPPQPPQQPGSNDDNQWLQIASKATGLDTTTPDRSSEIPTNNTTPQNGPTVLTPAPHTGIRGAIDKTLDSLAGTKRVQVFQDQQGNEYIQHPQMSRGQQWLKIGLTAAAGAAKGLAAGKGAGNMGRAAAAGLDTGLAIGDHGNQNTRDAQTEVANSQIQQHKLAEQAFEMQRRQIQASREDATWYGNQLADATKPAADGGPGGQDLGQIRDIGELARMMKNNPDAVKGMVERGDVRLIPAFDADGKADGFHAVLMPQDWGRQVMPPGSSFNVAVADPNNPGQYKLQEVKTSGPATARQIAQWNDAATAKVQAGQIAAHQQAQQAQAEADKHAETMATIGEKKSETAKNIAETRKTQQETQSEATNNPQNPQFEQMAQAIERGDILPADLKREAKGANLDPNALVARANEIAQQNGRTFSLPIIEQEHKFATNPKTQAVLDGIDRMLGTPSTPGFIDNITRYGEAAGLTDAAPWNELKLAVEQRLGNSAAKNFQTAVTETRRSIAGLIGNPLLGGGETDQKLKQADDLLGGNPTMDNLRKGVAILKQAMGSQRDSMVENNRYLRARYGQAGTGTSAPRAPQASAAQQPGTGKTISLAQARSLPQFQGQNDAQITMAAQALGYKVTQ